MFTRVVPAGSLGSTFAFHSSSRLSLRSPVLQSFLLPPGAPLRYASDRRAKPSGPLWDDGRRQGAVEVKVRAGLQTDPRPCMTRELGLCHHHSSSRGLVLPLLSSPYNHFQAFQSSTVVTGWEASERSGPDQTTERGVEEEGRRMMTVNGK